MTYLIKIHTDNTIWEFDTYSEMDNASIKTPVSHTLYEVEEDGCSYEIKTIWK